MFTVPPLVRDSARSPSSSLCAQSAPSIPKALYLVYRHAEMRVPRHREITPMGAYVADTTGFARIATMPVRAIFIWDVCDSQPGAPYRHYPAPCKFYVVLTDRFSLLYALTLIVISLLWGLIYRLYRPKIEKPAPVRCLISRGSNARRINFCDIMPMARIRRATHRRSPC